MENPTATENPTALRERFERDGFLVVPGFAAPDAIAALRARAAEIVAAFDPAAASGVFTTRDEAATKSDDYFLTSGDKVRCFFEEEAFDETGALRAPKALSINKIGHALHDLDPVFARFSRDPRLHAAGRWRWARRSRCSTSRCTSSSSRGSAARCGGTRTRPTSRPSRSA